MVTIMSDDPTLGMKRVECCNKMRKWEKNITQSNYQLNEREKSGGSKKKERKDFDKVEK